VQRFNDIVFVQFNAQINDRKISRKFDHSCAREEEHDENVRECVSDLPKEIRPASSVASSSTPRNEDGENINLDESDELDDDETNDDRDEINKCN
jgi:hypothetical protein